MWVCIKTTRETYKKKETNKKSDIQCLWDMGLTMWKVIESIEGYLH